MKPKFKVSKQNFAGNVYANFLRKEDRMIDRISRDMKEKPEPRRMPIEVNEIGRLWRY
uniref:Uncharacterized protein n=1 Tax=viral metagenome TaxID=1070528 RepID=A0A6M3JCP1_9ZZZZ